MIHGYIMDFGIVIQIVDQHMDSRFVKLLKNSVPIKSCVKNGSCLVFFSLSLSHELVTIILNKPCAGRTTTENWQVAF